MADRKDFGPAEVYQSNDSLDVGAEEQLMDTGSSGQDESGQDAAGKPRAQWGGKLEFILTCIGFAVGLGNVWRFPYLAYRNGGGAFLIPYVLMLAFVGLPIFYLELAFGQFASLGPIAIWRLNPVFRGLGFCMVIVSWLIALYYNVVISHTLFFLGASFTSHLPWQSCDNPWNSPHCVSGFEPTNVTNTTESLMVPTISPMNVTEMQLNSTAMGNKTAQLLQAAVTTAAAALNPLGDPSVGKVLKKGAQMAESERPTAAEEFYYNYVLQKSDGIHDMGPVSWQLGLCLFFAWVIVCAVLIKGISSLGKVVYFTAIFPYVMLTILLIRGVSLPGAGQGLYFYLYPNFEQLGNAKVWSDAATQIFYSLSACSGGLIAMASYNKFHNDCHRDCLIVSLINCGTSLYAGLVIFSVLGFIAHEKGVPVAEVAASGPGLAFIVYPAALARMPVAPLWSVFFFIMMATLGFGSQFSLVECVLSAITDVFPEQLTPRRNNIIFRIVSCFVMFLLGLPMVSRGGIYLLNLVDISVGGFPLLFVGFFEVAALVWIYGYSKFADDIRMMLGKPPNLYWKANWLVITPLVIAAVILFNCAEYKEPDYDDELYPDWAKGLGWCIALFPTLWIPGYATYYCCRFGGFDLLRFNMLPLSTWGPAKAEHRTGTEYEFVVNSDERGVGIGDAAQMGSVTSKNRWNTENIGYIHSVRSMLRTMSESSTTEPMQYRAGRSARMTPSDMSVDRTGLMVESGDAKLSQECEPGSTSPGRVDDCRV